MLPTDAMSEGALALLRTVIQRAPSTRAEIGETTGWARTTVNARLDELTDHGLLAVLEPSSGARGRPASRFAFDPDAGRILVAALGVSSARIATCDLRGRVIEQESLHLDATAPPADVLPRVSAGLHQLADRTDRKPLWGVGVSLPAPIEVATGTVVSPPIMSGWDGLVVPEWFADFGVPVVVLNDTDAMAWGEYIAGSPRVDNLLTVKAGTGIGAGLVAHGRILYGAQGAAGDLGHTYVEPPDGAEPPLCLCGKHGCIEAYAGGWAIARDLRTEGRDAHSVDDVMALFAQHDPVATGLLRRAGRVLGTGLAHAVSLFNPAEVVVVGQLALAGEHLLAGIRERVAARSLPLATRDLRIRVGAHPLESNVLGTADAVAARVVRNEP